MVGKHIRPITAYKKANPELYEVYNCNLDGKKLSKKQQEAEYNEECEATLLQSKLLT